MAMMGGGKKGEKVGEAGDFGVWPNSVGFKSRPAGLVGGG